MSAGTASHATDSQLIAAAQAFVKAGKPAAAVELLQARAARNGSAALRLALGKAWLELGEAERALACLPPTAAGLRDKAKVMLAAPRAPAPYLRHLFDQFAPTYDAGMRDGLAYRAPAILREVCEFVGAAASAPCDILDLGCGTGLAAERFADLARRIDGIDLSPRMLEKARERGLYAQLSLGDIESALTARGRRYDLVLAGDVLVYLGDLRKVFAGVARRLKPGGFFLFTVEQHDGAGFALGPKRRYRHGESYLREEAAVAHLEVMGLLACSPRDEAHEPVAGLAVALAKL